MLNDFLRRLPDATPNTVHLESTPVGPTVCVTRSGRVAQGTVLKRRRTAYSRSIDTSKENENAELNDDLVEALEKVMEEFESGVVANNSTTEHSLPGQLDGGFSSTLGSAPACNSPTQDACRETFLCTLSVNGELREPFPVMVGNARDDLHVMIADRLGNEVRDLLAVDIDEGIELIGKKPMVKDCLEDCTSRTRGG